MKKILVLKSQYPNHHPNVRVARMNGAATYGQVMEQAYGHKTKQ